MTPGPPFVVFSMPRSRSAWLAHWLTRVSERLVGHDLAIEADGIDHWLEFVARRFRGTCETGAVEIWPILRRALPACRIITIQGGPLASWWCASLTAARYDPPMDDLRRRWSALERLAAEDGVLSVPFDADLTDPRCCRGGAGACAVDIRSTGERGRAASGINIQVDAERACGAVDRTAPGDRLAEAGTGGTSRRTQAVRFGWRRAVRTDVADDAERMGAVHHAEATEALAGAYRLDQATLARLADGWSVAVSSSPAWMACSPVTVAG